jgi:RNA methyltransferase, TrmH family
MKLLSTARDLQRRKARERSGRFVAEGVRTVEALVQSPLTVEGVLWATGADGDTRLAAILDLAEERGIATAEVDPITFADAANTESPQGILAIAKAPVRSLASLRPLPRPARILVLDGVQDPGNVGTILRTAAALGAHATIALPGTVDLWNAKVVRSAMGTTFTHPTVSATADELTAFLSHDDVPLWGADAAGTSVRELTAPPRLALAVGNEGAGLSAALRWHVDANVALPIADDVESLNVAVATGILLYALQP